jgi:hypothetical protein
VKPRARRLLPSPWQPRWRLPKPNTCSLRRAQKPAKRERSTADSKQARAPQPAVSARALRVGPASPSLPAAGEHEALTPHTVRSVTVLPPSDPAVTAPSEIKATPRPDTDETQQQLVLLAVDDDIALTSIWPAQAPAPKPSLAFELLMLIVLCAAVTTDARGRIRGGGFLQFHRGVRWRPLRSNREPDPGPAISGTACDAKSSGTKWLLPTPGGRTVGDGFAYAFAHHWGSIWNCRYTGIPAASVCLPLAPRSVHRDGFQLDRVWPDLQVRLRAHIHGQILISDPPAA